MAFAIFAMTELPFQTATLESASASARKGLSSAATFDLELSVVALTMSLTKAQEINNLLAFSLAARA